MSEKELNTNKKQFTDYLTFLANNQGLWHEICKGGIGDGGTVYIAESLDTLFEAGYYELAVQAVFGARNDFLVSQALTRMFLALLAEKAEQAGVEAVKEMFISALRPRVAE